MKYLLLIVLFLFQHQISYSNDFGSKCEQGGGYYTGSACECSDNTYVNPYIETCSGNNVPAVNLAKDYFMPLINSIECEDCILSHNPICIDVQYRGSSSLDRVYKVDNCPMDPKSMFDSSGKFSSSLRDWSWGAEGGLITYSIKKNVISNERKITDILFNTTQSAWATLVRVIRLKNTKSNRNLVKTEYKGICAAQNMIGFNASGSEYYFYKIMGQLMDELYYGEENQYINPSVLPKFMLNHPVANEGKGVMGMVGNFFPDNDISTDASQPVFFTNHLESKDASDQIKGPALNKYQYISFLCSKQID